MSQHFANPVKLVKLAHAAGIGGIYSRSPSQTLSTTGFPLLTLATGANISKTAQNLLFSHIQDDDLLLQKDRSPKKIIEGINHQTKEV